MAAGLCAALGLDRPELQTPIVAVLEHDWTDSSFVLSSIMWEWLVGRPTRAGRAMGALLPRTSESSSAVLLITSHHSFSHYRVQSVKLGLNLSSFKQKGNFEVLDLLNLIGDTLHTSNADEETFDENCCINLQNLYLRTRKMILGMLEKYKSLCLVIENIDDILLIGATVSEVIVLLNYFRNLSHEFQGVTVVISAHICNHEEQHCVLKAYLRNVSNLSVTVSGLQTGLFKDISGSLSVNSDFSSPCMYHYLLLDRQIKIFAPGTS